MNYPMDSRLASVHKGLDAPKPCSNLLLLVNKCPASTKLSINLFKLAKVISAGIFIAISF